jgi:uncharacterized protein YbaR (Trm112 family)
MASDGYIPTSPSYSPTDPQYLENSSDNGDGSPQYGATPPQIRPANPDRQPPPVPRRSTLAMIAERGTVSPRNVRPLPRFPQLPPPLELPPPALAPPPPEKHVDERFAIRCDICTNLLTGSQAVSTCDKSHYACITCAMKLLSDGCACPMCRGTLEITKASQLVVLALDNLNGMGDELASQSKELAAQSAKITELEARLEKKEGNLKRAREEADEAKNALVKLTNKLLP